MSSNGYDDDEFDDESDEHEPYDEEEREYEAACQEADLEDEAETEAIWQKAKEKEAKEKVESEESEIRRKKLEVLHAIEESLQNDKMDEAIRQHGSEYIQAIYFLLIGYADSFKVDAKTVSIEEGKLTFERSFEFYKDGKRIFVDGYDKVLSSEDDGKNG